MLRNINGHTFDMSNIGDSGWVLDLGSRDFNDFKHPETFQSVMLEKGLNVISVDPYKNITFRGNILNDKNFNFVNKACVGINNGEKMEYFEYRDSGANSLYNKNSNHRIVQNKGSDFLESYDVDTITISELMEEFNVVQFEAIKMDIEGGEYDILLNFPDKCTKQISIEFHDWLNLNPYEDSEDFYKIIEKTTMSNYSVEFKKKVLMGDGYTYSDVLYVLK